MARNLALGSRRAQERVQAGRASTGLPKFMTWPRAPRTGMLGGAHCDFFAKVQPKVAKRDWIGLKLLNR